MTTYTKMNPSDIAFFRSIGMIRDEKKTPAHKGNWTLTYKRQGFPDITNVPRAILEVKKKMLMRSGYNDVALFKIVPA